MKRQAFLRFHWDTILNHLTYDEVRDLSSILRLFNRGPFLLPPEWDVKNICLELGKNMVEVEIWSFDFEKSYQEGRRQYLNMFWTKKHDGTINQPTWSIYE